MKKTKKRNIISDPLVLQAGGGEGLDTFHGVRLSEDRTALQAHLADQVERCRQERVCDTQCVSNVKNSAYFILLTTLRANYRSFVLQPQGNAYITAIHLHHN